MLPVLIVFLPFFSAFFVPLIERTKPGRSSFFVAAICSLCFAATVLLYPQIKANAIVISGIFNPGIGIDFFLRVDALGFLVGLAAAFLWLLASIYSLEYMQNKHALGRYNVFWLFSFVGILGVAFAGNLPTLYVFFEFLTISAYILVIHEESGEALEAGLLYLFLGIAGGLILLFSVIAAYTISGGGDLSSLGMGLKDHPLAIYIFWGFIIGFGIKAGIFPLHVWLPKAHPVAPSPASALLSGIMIKAGAYGILRTIFTVIGADFFIVHPVPIKILSVLALISILYGSALAIAQTEIKKLLAYSSITQMGYIILGISLLSPAGLSGGVIHIFNHALIKGCLFLSAGAFIHQTGLRQLKDLSGIGKRMPLTLGCFTLAALSMIGFPPFNGFISKWYLALGSLETAKLGLYPKYFGFLALGTLIISSLLNLIYYGPIVYNGWFSNINNHQSPITNYQKNADPNLFILIPLILLAGGILFFGMYPGLPVSLAEQISGTFFVK